MARLNEPPAAPTATALQPGTENVDALKRRFIRQNRELAKNNSTQSLRIRTLELDVSRLLAENLELRNQVLHLQNEVYTAQSAASTAAVRKVKDELQAKIAELSGLVDGIEDVQQDVWNEARQRRPLEGNWRERQPLSELMRDSQMPTISEDKTYPRRTLDAQGIQAIRLSDHSSNESPDLGPPPVAHFDYVDPVKNASPLVNKVLPDAVAREEEEELPAQLSVNLETRRKRKDCQPKLEIRRHSILAQSPSKGEGETSSILRTGAKRKLADRETEKPIKPPSKGDFTFSRKVPSEESRAMSKPLLADAEPVSPSPRPVRKVLGDKSVNMSPRKAATILDEKAEKDKAAAIPRNDPTTRRRRLSAIPIATSPQSDEVIEVAARPAPPPPPPPSSEIPPKTPALADLFSPAPSEPSTLPDQGRGDTPPPADLSALSISSTDSTLRPSRRARSAVNYAEPSLISKMRRPDKKMVDALTGLPDPRRRAMGGSYAVGEKGTTTAGAAAPAGGAVIKKEPLDDEELDEQWKVKIEEIASESPLRVKSAPEAENTNGDPVSSSPPTNPPSISTTSTLVAPSRKRRESARTHSPTSATTLGTDIEAATKKMEEMDIYEFKESSSPVSTDDIATAAAAGNRPRIRTHRRHSSVPKDLGDGSRSAGGSGSGSGVGIGGRSERAASRRKSMMV